MKKGLNELMKEYILNSNLKPSVNDIYDNGERKITTEYYRVKKADVISFGKEFENEFDLQELYSLEDEFEVQLKFEEKSFIDELNAMLSK